mmetsp:Transcript_1671/g.2852  ORF Transcript_1671/g.2852 Transcript_1671/m.2852 type:complete len:329 (+) Transcript_1671:1088-2074(+)
MREAVSHPRKHAKSICRYCETRSSFPSSPIYTLIDSISPASSTIMNIESFIPTWFQEIFFPGNTAPSRNNELLHECIEDNNAIEVIRLLDLGADLEYRQDEEGYTALHVAVMRGNQQITWLLLDRGADISTADLWGRTPLILACVYNHLEIVKLLLSRGADIEQVDGVGYSPLTCSALRGHDAIVEYLIPQGSSIESKENTGITPLLAAISSHHFTTTLILIEHKADIECRDDVGRTALATAALFGFEDIVMLLLDHHANINCVDKDGDSILSLMVMNWNMDESARERMFRLLLRHGVDRHIRNRNHETVYDIALRYQKNSILHILNS